MKTINLALFHSQSYIKPTLLWKTVSIFCNLNVYKLKIVLMGCGRVYSFEILICQLLIHIPLINIQSLYLLPLENSYLAI